MGKDPAVLFYTSDFLTGTMTMSNEQVGMYIRLLCLQHQKGKLTKEDMLYICKTYVKDVFSKFIQNGDDFYNKRMLIETEKRRNYSESRRRNVLMKKKQSTGVSTYVKHMENENENENENIIKNKDRFEEIWSKYPNKDGKKLAFRHFNSSVKTEQDWVNINKALDNYLKCEKVKKGYIKNGSTWFNNWTDWIDYKEERVESPQALRAL